MPGARILLAASLLQPATVPLPSTGPVVIFGIVEKVVFEPGEASPERLQVWGAFALVEGTNQTARLVSNVTRGYLYFRLPVGVGAPEIEAVKREWADLKRIADTGQAVRFGRWTYIRRVDRQQPGASDWGIVLDRVRDAAAETDLRVRAALETPRAPSAYQTNAGVVKLPETGNHAAIVKDLRAALKR
jgi:hypothetical protein